MKKFTKIISMICVLTFMLSLSAFAAEAFDDVNVIYKLEADKESYNVGDEVTVTLSADGKSGAMTFDCLWATICYDVANLEFVSDSLNNATPEVKGDGTGTLTFEIEEEDFTTAWDSLIVLKFNALANGEFDVFVEDVTFACMEGGEVLYDELPSVTITVAKAADPEPVVRPTGLSTTYSVGGKTYTEVPNKKVTATATGATEGTVTLTYWYNGVDGKTATKRFTTAAAALTGTTGTVTFDVAITGVPGSVVITDIAVAFDAVN